jgi:hypothetical protein
LDSGVVFITMNNCGGTATSDRGQTDAMIEAVLAMRIRNRGRNRVEENQRIVKKGSERVNIEKGVHEGNARREAG